MKYNEKAWKPFIGMIYAFQPNLHKRLREFDLKIYRLIENFDAPICIFT